MSARVTFTRRARRAAGPEARTCGDHSHARCLGHRAMVREVLRPTVIRGHDDVGGARRARRRARGSSTKRPTMSSASWKRPDVARIVATMCTRPCRRGRGRTRRGAPPGNRQRGSAVVRAVVAVSRKRVHRMLAVLPAREAQDAPGLDVSALVKTSQDEKAATFAPAARASSRIVGRRVRSQSFDEQAADRRPGISV